MDGKEMRISVERFVGVDQSVDEADMDLTMSRRAWDCDASGGQLQPGAGPYADSMPAIAGGTVRTLMVYRKNQNGEAIERIVAATDSDIFAWKDTGWLSISGALPVTNGYFSWVNTLRSGTELLVMANGSDDVYCWDGVGDIRRLAGDASYTVGMPSADVGNNIIRLTRHGLAEGEMIVFDGYAGTLPTGLAENETYFVRNHNDDRFQVSATENGNIIDIKSAGTAGWRLGRPKWLDSVSVNPNTELFTCSNHGLLQNDRLVIDQAEGTGTPPGGTAFNTVYYAQIIDVSTFTLGKVADEPGSIVNVTTAGSGWKMRRFDVLGWVAGEPDADPKSSQIRMNNHGFKNGAAVEFTVSAGVLLPAGLAENAIYYVLPINEDQFKLSTSMGGKPVNLTGSGATGWAIRSLAADEWKVETPGVNKDTDTLTLWHHGFGQGTSVMLGVADENSYLPDGLFAGVEYTVINPTANSFQLSSSPTSTRPVDLTGNSLKGWGVRKKGATAWLGGQATNDPATNTIQTSSAHGLKAGDTVLLGVNETLMLPTGITAGQTYYVCQPTTNGFKISTSPTGSPVVSLTNGGIAGGWRVRPEEGMWKPAAPTVNAQGIIVLNSHGFAAGQPVVFDTPNADGFMPGGIQAHNGGKDGKYYYVVNATQHTFQVAEKPGGTPVKFTSPGSTAFRVRPSDENRPMGSSLALYAGRLWCAGERTHPDDVYYSAEDQANWVNGDNAAGVKQRPAWDGDHVVAIAPLFDALAVFKSHGMYRILGTYPKEFQTAALTAPAGALSPRAVRAMGDKAYYLAADGLYVYDGMRAVPLHRGALREVFAGLNRSPEALKRACLAARDGKLYAALATGGSAENNTVIEYDGDEDAFMVRQGLRVDCWLETADALKFARANAAGTASSLYVYGVQGPQSQPVSMHWETPTNDLGLREAEKVVTRVLVTGSGGALKLTVRADGRQASRTLTLPAEPAVETARFSLRGRRVGLTLENVSGSRPMVSGATIVYEEEEDG